MPKKAVTKLAARATKTARAAKTPPKPVISGKASSKVAAKPEIKVASKSNLKAAARPGEARDERIHSHPTMCLHCHLIVEMFHERGADPVKGAWQCPRCGHKYLFSHWKIKRQARGKPEAA